MPATGPRASAIALPVKVLDPAVARNASPMLVAACAVVWALAWILEVATCILAAMSVAATPTLTTAATMAVAVNPLENERLLDLPADSSSGARPLVSAAPKPLALGITDIVA